MSSIYRNQWEDEAREEINELLKKRSDQGWNQSDADRYNYLIKELGDE
jgi:hypothetical protein